MSQKQYNPRRNFSVKEKLVGKLGQQGFGQLLQGLEAITGPAEQDPRPKRRRRGGRGRKAVEA